MRVCMVAYTFYETDNRVMRYAETLVKRGDQVDVIALRQPGQSSREVMDGVNVFRIQERVLNERRRSSYLFRVLLFFVRSMVFLTWKHLQTRYDLIHVHSVPDLLVFVAWVPKLMGSAVLLDIHDLLPEFYASKFKTHYDSPMFKLLLAIERVSAAFSHHVIIANHLWHGTLLSRSVGNGKCTVILNIPDPAIFSGQARDRKDDKFIILYPGTLHWHQGLDIAIRAFALIKDEAPQAEFHIYGEGQEKDPLAELVETLGVQGRVFLKKILPLREIASVIANSDLGVVPKRKDSFGNEAFSTKILEFMALGVPVIVSDTKVDQYYFRDSVVTFFRGGDEKELARCMLQLMRDPDLRQRLVRNASDFIAHNNWDANKADYLQLVDSLTGPRPAESVAAVSDQK